MSGAIIAAIYVAYRLGTNPVLTFWLAYILTRPLGASLGDLLSRARAYGGFGLGTITTSISFLAIIVVLVARLSDRQRRRSTQTPPGAADLPRQEPMMYRRTLIQTLAVVVTPAAVFAAEASVRSTFRNHSELPPEIRLPGGRV